MTLTKSARSPILLAGLTALGLALVACDGAESEETAADPAAGHAHAAPHGGVLVPLGDHAANVELVWDAEAGAVDAYVLDGCAEAPIRVEQQALVLTLERAGDEPLALELAAVADRLSGETVGDTSRFRGSHPALAGVDEIEGTLGTLTLRGQPFEATAFRLSHAVHVHDENCEHGREEGHDGQDQDGH